MEYLKFMNLISYGTLRDVVWEFSKRGFDKFATLCLFSGLRMFNIYLIYLYKYVQPLNITHPWD